MKTDTKVRQVLMPEDLARPPRYATRRNPDLKTRGGKIGVLAAGMGKILLPHQDYIASVAGELNPVGSRLRFRYQLVVVSLPRQAGKTTLMRPIFVERALSRPRTQAFMTAQKGKDATARWNDLVEDIETNALLSHYAHLLRSKGGERCSFPNGSFISPFTPSKDGLHGYSPELVQIDEGWAFDEEAGADLLKAIRPAQITKTDRQLFIISAAGDATSTWWNPLVKAGRESVKDPHSKMAYFEWSADPGADPMDPATWEYHPGLDGLITIDDLKEEAKPENNSHADFLRGFLNRSTDQQDNLVFPLPKWHSGTVDYLDPIHLAKVHLAYDVAIDSTAATVYASWKDPEGLKHLALVETREDTEWLTPYLDTLMRTTPAMSLSADDGGPTRIITDELQRLGHQVNVLAGKDSSTAWAAFKAEVTAPQSKIRHDASTAITDAIKVATERKTGDTVSLSRSRSLGPIDPLVAATVAAWQADRAGPGLQVW